MEDFESRGVLVYLIDSAIDVDLSWFANVDRVGITAGASAPESLVQEVISFLQENFDVASISPLPGGVKEDVVFHLPKGVR